MSEPRWLKKAWEYDGLQEIKGEKDHPKIIEWHELCGVQNPTDEIAWCASFVSGVLEESGVKSARSASSKAYLKWGEESPIEPGAIVVFRGHVAIVSAMEPELMIIGGNQSDGICEQPARYYGEILPNGIRWPTENLVETSADMESPAVVNTTPGAIEELAPDDELMLLIKECMQQIAGCRDAIETAQKVNHEELCKKLDTILEKMHTPSKRLV